MEASIEQAVTRAITTMEENIGEPLSVDDMARAAMFSKFHFTRIFLRATGVSPGRFLSALRLQRAKKLLVSTSLNVADISMLVGYNSVGTFSSRFSRSVGMSPTAYRRTAGFARDIPTDPGEAGASSPAARIFGRLGRPEPTQPGPVFIGLFPGRIPEGRPGRCAILESQTHYHFDNVPPGMWYVLAQCVAENGTTVEPDDWARSVSVGTHGPLAIEPGMTLHADLALREASALDPPVLTALLDARRLARRRAGAAGAFSPMRALASQRSLYASADLPAA